MTDQDTDDLIGKTFREMPLGGWDNARGDKGKLWHVRGVVDDRLVVRRWRRAKNRWHYEVIPRYIITYMLGRAYRVKSKPLLTWLERDTEGETVNGHA